MSKQKRNTILYIFGSLLVVLVLVWSAVFSQATKAQDEFLEVIFFDVGQGDGIFIETPGGRQILIDGGPNSTVLKKLAQEMPFYDREIDIVILTHPEADHMYGLINVLNSYSVRLVLDSGIQKDTSIYHEYKKLLEDKKIPYQIVFRGDTIKIGEDIALDILHPGDNLYSDANNNSVVVRMIYGNNSFLLAGDIERQVEYGLVVSNQYIASDVLKVAHHGSKTSSGELFLKSVEPEIAVISVGEDNKYGHPSPLVLENLEKYGIKVLRTDIDGDIKILSDGEGIAIE